MGRIKKSRRVGCLGQVMSTPERILNHTNPTLTMRDTNQSLSKTPLTMGPKNANILEINKPFLPGEPNGPLALVLDVEQAQGGCKEPTGDHDTNEQTPHLPLLLGLALP